MTLSPVTPSPHQLLAADAIKTWWQSHLDNDKNVKPFFYLAGYAGTGKTSIAKYLVTQLEPRAGEAADLDDEPNAASLMYTFAAFTGKASLMLARKGCEPSSTIHSLIYQRSYNDTTKEFFFEKRESLRRKYDLLILDECSMINFEMGNDLLSFNVPILVLGDPGQLPPVEGAGFFTSTDPDFFLTEIHRQAEDSPILNLATRARKGEDLPPSTKTFNGSTVTITTSSPILKTLLSVDQVICGTNRTRVKINTLFRQAKQFTSPLPQLDDKLICLKNNWDVTDMCNGAMWRVVSIEPLSEKHSPPNRLAMSLQNWDDPEASWVNVVTHKCFFDSTVAAPEGRDWKGLTHFTFGYCITCHKSQGSEWDSIFVYNESKSFREHSAKWLYTAITRAARNLIIY